jgi:hypothetical protein
MNEQSTEVGRGSGSGRELQVLRVRHGPSSDGPRMNARASNRPPMSRQGKHLVHACYCASNPQDAASPRSICSRNATKQSSTRSDDSGCVGSGRERRFREAWASPSLRLRQSASLPQCTRQNRTIRSPGLSCVPAQRCLVHSLPMGLILLNWKMRASRTATLPRVASTRNTI